MTKEVRVTRGQESLLVLVIQPQLRSAQFLYVLFFFFFFYTHTHCILFLQEINRLTPSIVHG